MCVSVKGVNLWNNYETELKNCESLAMFNKSFKNIVLQKYVNQVMNHHLLFVLLSIFLSVAPNGWCQKEEVCFKSIVNSCNDCVRSGPFCAWCQQLNFTKAGEQESARCETRAKLMERGCKEEEIIDPVSSQQIDKNEPLSTSFNMQEPIQLSPQKISLRLRPGLPTTFSVSFKRVQGYPVDLYYLMDLSFSMRDDLENVKELGQDLLATLKKITEHAQIGFGAFVDKTVLPYTNTNKNKLQRPCDENYQCQATFGYRHVLSMTPRIDEFKEKVTEQLISGNLDSPEGSLDAMMQAAVCGDKIGWRNSSTRLLVLATDDGFHMAGDGKLAGILEPNDEQCHVKNTLYTKSNEMISFDVTVTADSCIKNKTFSIRPLGIKDTLTVTLTTNCECQCKDPSESSQQYCNGKGRISCGICSCSQGSVGQFCECSIGNKDEHSLRASCVSPSGIECESHGDCVCGRCQCHTTASGGSYYGDFCECDDEHCEKFQNRLCGGNGKCNCGKCECYPGFDGSACQCIVSEEECRTPNNTICYGRGDCKCNRCECIKGYQRPHCQDCLGCPDTCQIKLNCIECLGFESGPLKKNCSMACRERILHEMVDQFTFSSPLCRQRDTNGCWIKFKLDQQFGEDKYIAEIMQQRECPEPPSVVAIIGGSIASVALIGILLLMLIKLLIYMRDLKEFRKFENEKKKSKWAEADNPLFQNATTTVTNPTFTGE
ncbi:integrin beta-2 isoform X4 [Vanacampus margaritifer]